MLYANFALDAEIQADSVVSLFVPTQGARSLKGEHDLREGQQTA